MTLETLRRRYGLSQTELAKMLGTTQSELSRIEKGSRKPRPKLASKIRAMFGLTTDQIWDMFYSDKGGDADARSETLHRRTGNKRPDGNKPARSAVHPKSV